MSTPAPIFGQSYRRQAARKIAIPPIRALAVIDGRRSRQMPDLPTLNETLPNFYNVVAWYGFLGPLGLPRPIAERLSGEIHSALQEPDVVARLDALGISSVGSTPDELQTRMKNDIDNIGKLVSALAIKPE